MLDRRHVLRRCGSVALALLVCGAAHAQPANDECTSAAAISDGDTPYSTVDATNNGPLHPVCKFDPETYNDIWFRYQASCTGTLTVSTCGTAIYDSDLVVYDGCSCGALERSFLACNDDGNGCPNFSSELTADVTDGSCYLIRVGGFSATSEGEGVVNVSCVEPGDSACCLPDESCIVTDTADCAAQGGEFQPGATTCDAGACATTTGPDVIYSDCDSTVHWGDVGGIHGYSLQSQTCNVGDTNLSWNFQGPLLAMNAYRLVDGRLTQIGMSWMKNATVAVAGSGCEPPCQGGGGSVLGPGCQDIYSAGFNGGHGILGPRSDVNAFTGAYPGPSGGSGDAIYKRLQIAESDMSPTNGLYFVEGHYVAADDAASGNAMNNASYKRATVSGTFAVQPLGPMFEARPAIFAWQDHGLGVDVADPSVEVVAVDVPGEGRFHIASKVTDLGGGTWLYDYAVRNHNSHRSGRSLAVPVPTGVSVQEVGFHDVDYHSGEPYDDTPWTGVVSAAGVTWSSPQTFEENPDANALRFATMYNFWFEADGPPGVGPVTLGLFRPSATGPDSVSVTLPVPSPTAASPAGAVPDGHAVPGTPLRVGRNGGLLELTWDPSCLGTDLDYAVYQGTIGDFTDPHEVACGTGGATSTTVALTAVDSYYLVVPQSSNRQGSYGLDSSGAERPPAATACLPQTVASCPGPR